MRKIPLFSLILASLQVGPLSGQENTAGSVTVSELLASQDAYVGQRLRVTGRISIVAYHSLLPCAEDQPDCSQILGVDLFLEDSDDTAKRLPVYDRGSPYECFSDLHGAYGCGEFRNGSLITLEGLYSKGKKPELVVGGSSPSTGSSPPQAVTYTDFYYFDVGSLTASLAVRGERQTGNILPHYAIGSNTWATDFHVFNLNSGSASFVLSFYDNDGNPDALNLFTDTGQPLGAISSFAGVVPAGGAVVLKAPVVPEMHQGYAVLEATDSSSLGLSSTILAVENGEPIFRTFVPGLEHSDSLRALYFDSGDLISGMALANTNPFIDATVNLIFRNRAGAELCRVNKELPAGTHVAFLLRDDVPCTAGTDGVLDIISDNWFVAAIVLVFDQQRRMWTQIPYDLCCANKP
jgi:hypothetical protein